MPFFSFIITVYNGERYLEEAIVSVLSQPCRDIELIISNDGSTDGSLEIAAMHGEADERVKILNHPNVGAGASRNLAIDEANGAVIVFLDSDDVILPGFFSDGCRQMLQSLINNGIEMIVPARVLSDEALQTGEISTVPHDGQVFPARSAASWDIHHEFATCIYSGDLIRRNNLHFYETRPEMELIYRHRAAFLSNKTLFTNDLYFAVRRDNPYQTVKNWDWTKVQTVRAKGFKSLIEWHESIGTTGEVLERATSQYLEAVSYRPSRTLAQRISSILNTIKRNINPATQAERVYTSKLSEITPSSEQWNSIFDIVANKTATSKR